MQKGYNYQLMIRRILLVMIDSVCIVAAQLLALLTRFEFQVNGIAPEFVKVYGRYGIIFLGITILTFGAFKLYSSLWEFVGTEEIKNIVVASIISGLLILAFLEAIGENMPRSWYLLNAMYLIFMESGFRVFYRRMRLKRNVTWRPWEKKSNILIIGAGEAGRALIKEIRDSRFLNQKIVGLIDDDKKKHGCYVNGIKVLGGRELIQKTVSRHGVDEIIISIPSAPAYKISEIVEVCKDTGCRMKIVPGVYQLVNGEVRTNRLREVKIQDLLGRTEISVNLEEVMAYVEDRVVLVTGGGGSIGSELCRQIAMHQPKKLIIFDIYENNAYDIQQELRKKYPKLELITLIGSVRDEERLEQVFTTYHPEIVYHAAAHKHVPLMEDSPNEAIKNNVLGTYKLVKAADRFGVKRFVQISTDKAVNPTNIMGASKRICEMIIQTMDKHSKTEFVAVRFGNVLGSNGSVIPLFEKQIKEGGPVTVTHPDVIRYFMTIQEAVSLVLQAGAYAKGGEIFVLDMGEPVKINDLAQNMIRLSGYVPNEDIQIVYTGLRPGEKLYEELLMKEEGMTDTPNKLIHIGHPIPVEEEQLIQALKQMEEAVKTETWDIKELVKQIVPTYKESVTK